MKAEQLRTISRVANSNGFPYGLQDFRPSEGFGGLSCACRKSSPGWFFSLSHQPPGEAVTQGCCSYIPPRHQVPKGFAPGCLIPLLTTSREGCPNGRHIPRAKGIVLAELAAPLINAARLNCVWRRDRWAVNLGGCRDGEVLCMGIIPYLYMRAACNNASV